MKLIEEMRVEKQETIQNKKERKRRRCHKRSKWKAHIKMIDLNLHVSIIKLIENVHECKKTIKMGKNTKQITRGTSNISIK